MHAHTHARTHTHTCDYVHKNSVSCIFTLKDNPSSFAVRSTSRNRKMLKLRKTKSVICVKFEVWIRTYKFICTGCNFGFLTRHSQMLCGRIRWFVLKWKFVTLVLHYIRYEFSSAMWAGGQLMLSLQILLGSDLCDDNLAELRFTCSLSHWHIIISYDGSSTFKITVVERTFQVAL